MEFDQRPDGRVPLPFTERRHRAGPRAPGQRPPAGPDQLRHRPVHADPRPDARAAGPRPRRLRERALQLPGHRRPLARGDVPDRRRRPALERGPRLRPAPALPARGPPRPAARPSRAVHGRDGLGRHRRHGRGVPAPRRRVARRSSASSRARRRSSRGRSMPGRSCSSEAPLAGVDVGARAVVGGGRTTCPADAPRLPGDVAFRLHDTYGFPIDLTVELAAEYGVARRPRRDSRRALAEQRERSRSGTKAELSKHAELAALYGAIQGRAGDTRVPRLRDDDRRGPGRRDRPRRDGVRRADRPRRSRGRPRPDAVLCRGRRPGRRPGRPARAGWRQRAVRR